MALGEINGISPTTGSGAKEKINPAFPSTFDRTLFNVVPFNTASSPIPSGNKPVGGLVLTGIFGAKGYDCTNSKAKTDIQNYGFITLSTCGATS